MSKVFKIFSILLLFCTFPIFYLLGNEQLYFTNIGIKEGLPNSNANCFYQDNLGFMWIGTGNGLCKYSGEKVEVFRNNSLDTTTISGNQIKKIIGVKDANGEKLWIATSFDGISILDLKTNTFLQLKNESGKVKKLTNNRCSDLLLLSNGLIACINTGIDFIDPGTMKIYKDPMQLKRTPLVIAEHKGQLYIGTRNGIVKLRLPTIKKGFSFSQGQEIILPGISVDMIISTEKEMFLGTYLGLKKYDPSKNCFSEIAIPSSSHISSGYSFKESFIDKKNNELWLAVYGLGGYRYNISRNSITKINSPQNFNISNINSIYFDRFGSIWLGTYKEGVLKASLLPEKFSNIKLAPPQNSLYQNDIYSFLNLPDDQLLIGNNSGNIYIKNKEGQIKPLKFLTQNPFISPNSLIGSLYYDIENENLWIGNMSKSLMVVPFKKGTNGEYEITGKGTVFRGDSLKGGMNISGWSVRAITKDKNGYIWVGTFDGGLTKINPKTLNKVGVINSPPLFGIRSIFKPLHGWHDNIIWVTTENGLFFFNTDNHKYRHISELHPPKDEFLPLSNIIWSVYQESSNRFWLCTYTNGLALLEIPLFSDEKNFLKGNGKDIKVTYFTGKNGIPEGELYAIIPDKNNNLWISCDKGLVKFSLKNLRGKLYSLQQPHEKQDLNFGAFCASSDSQNFYFGGSNGITFFKPSAIKDQPLSLPVINGLKVMERKVTAGDTLMSGYIVTESIPYSDYVELAYNENLLTFNLNILNFNHDLGDAIFYKLEGVDESWQKANGPEYLVTYSNLRPGNYSMKLRTGNPTGPGPEDILDIKINAPWWSTLYAYMLYGLMFLAFLLIFRRIIVYRERYKAQLEIERLEFKKLNEMAEKTHELDQMKIRFFMNVSHELRTPLTLILGPLHKLQQGLKGNDELNTYFELISRNSQKLLRLINQLLDFRRLELGKVKPNFTEGDIIDFVSQITSNYTITANSENISIDFVPGSSQLKCLFDHDIVEKITDNLISNAIKYNKKQGNVTIKAGIGDDKGSVQIKVIDTGIGIAEHEKELIFDPFYRTADKNKKYSGVGIGLSYSKELANLHGGSLQVESNDQKGSTFTFTFPLVQIEDVEQKTPQQACSDHTIVPTSPYNGTGAHEIIVPELHTPNHQSTRPLVLLVDDNPEILVFICGCLKDEFNILTALNGCEALDKLQSYSPDVIISDILMPEMDGIELTQKLQSQVETSHIPIILLTALTTQEKQIEGLVSGAYDYITKPFNEEALKLKIKNIFNSRKRLAEKLSSTTLGSEFNLPFTSLDNKFIEDVNRAISQNLDNPEFNTEHLASLVGMSRSLLFKKFKALLNTTAGDYILSVKMKAAGKLLMETDMNISEVCYSVGFADPKYFTKVFKQYYNVVPTEYRNMNKKKC